MKNKLYLLSFAALLTFMLAGCESATTPSGSTIIVAPSNRTFFAVSEGNEHNNSTLDAILFRHDSTGYDTIYNHGVLTGMGEGNDVLVTGNHVLVLDEGSNTLYILSADSLNYIATIPFAQDGPNKMALIGSNLLLVTRRSNNSAAIVDLTKNAIVDSIDLGEPSIAVAVLNNKAFITGGNYNSDGHLHVINLTTNQQISSSALLSGPERAVADSASGQIVLGCDGVYPATVAPRIYWVNASTNTLIDSANAVSLTASITFTTGGRVSLIQNGILLSLDNIHH